MLRRALNLFKFRLERFLLRGAIYRLLFIAALLGLFSLCGGLVVHVVSGGFDSTADAVWWAFLRLSDPGYLGDDVGTFRRIISTVLTVAGYVLFLGALVAIMTQWLNQTIRRLESGYTPIAQNDHVLLVGWNSRTATILRELLQSEGRVRRFLSLHGARFLHVVLLAEEAGPELSYELRDRLGPYWRESQITIRSGNSLVIQHLRRVDFAHAAAIVVPADDRDGPVAADTVTIKTLLSMSTHGRVLTDEVLPLVVAEIFDARKLHVARRAYQGPVEVLATDRAIGRVMAQSLRLPGIGNVYWELSNEGSGNTLHAREAPELVGRPFHDLITAYQHAVPLGVARRHGKSFRPLLAPGADFVLEEDDRVVLVAREWDHTVPDPGADRPELPPPSSPAPAEDETRRRRRLLLVGWSHKAPPLLRELERYTHEEAEVDVLSATPAAEREETLRRYTTLTRTRVRMIEGDRTLPADIRSVSPAEYDNIILLGSDWAETKEESDARTVVTYLLLREILDEAEGRSPDILVELFDRSNAALFEDQPVHLVVSPLLIGRMLAQIALRQELRAVYDQLLGTKGPELTFRRPGTYGLTGGERSFRELQAHVLARGDVLLGVRTRAGMELNPERGRTWRADDQLELLILTRTQPVASRPTGA